MPAEHKEGKTGGRDAGLPARAGLSSPWDLHQAHEDLLRLLMWPQAPGVAMRLQSMLIDATLAMGWAEWAAYGLAMARRLALLVHRESLLGWEPREIAHLQNLLARCLAQDAVDIAGTQDWPDLAHRAKQRLDDHAMALEAWLRGEAAELPQPGGVDPGVLAYVPVVADVAGGNQVPHQFAQTAVAAILPLRVRVFPSGGRKRRPQLVVEGGIAHASRDALDQALHGLESAALPFAPRLSELLITVQWSQDGARLAGGSAGLGFALATWAGWSDLAPGSGAWSLDPAVVATGVLDGRAVLPVDPATLESKITACFFSPLRLLLVPGRQALLAKEILARLHARYPLRGLELRGVDDVCEILPGANGSSVAGIFVRRRRSTREAMRSIAAALRRSRIRRAALALGGLVTLGLTIWMIVVTRGGPVGVAWEGDDIVVRNSHDWATLRIHLPPALDTKVNVPLSGALLSLVDLNGNGSPEVVALHGRQPTRPDLLSAFDRHGNRLWSASVGGDLDASVPDVDGLCWRPFHLLRPSSTLGATLLTVRRSPQGGQCFVDLRDGATGEALKVFSNPGHVDLIISLDVNHDGVAEWIAIGTHMPSSSGLLVVFEIDEMATWRQDGASATPTGLVTELTDPSSLRTGVGQAFLFAKDRFTPAERVHCIAVEEDAGGLVRVDVTGYLAAGAAQYHFAVGRDGGWQLRRVRISDGKRISIRVASPSGMSQEQIAAEETRLRDAVQVLTALGWEPLEQSRGQSESADPGGNEILNGHSSDPRVRIGK